MYCQKCGAENTNDAVFCEKCGTKLEKSKLEEVTTNTPTYTVAKKAPAKQKRPISKLELIVLAEVVLVIGMGFFASSLLKKRFSAEYVAEKYFVSFVNGDYKEAYDLLDVDESTFVNKDTFSKYCKTMNFEKIANYEVKTYSDRDSSLGKAVVVNYRSKGHESDQTFYLNLVKSSDKKYIFFDQWSVGYNNILCTNYQVAVLNGAKVLLDGIELTDQYAVDNQSIGYTVYQIPKLFRGNHTIEVSLEGRETIVKNVSITEDDDEIDLCEMYYSTEFMENLEKMAYNNMQTIYDCAAKGKSFDEISQLISRNVEYLDGAKETYNSLVEYFKDEYGPIEISIQNVQTHAYTDASEITVSFDYTIKYNSLDWWSGEVTREEYSGQDSFEISFIFEDGKWVQKYLGCPQLYYW